MLLIWIKKIFRNNKKSPELSKSANILANKIINKNELIIKKFSNLKKPNSEVLKSLIMKELKTEKVYKNVFSGDYCFQLNELPDLIYEISYTNDFNFGCSSAGGILNGFSVEYFHKIKIFSLYLKNKKEHLKGEKTTELADSVYWSLLLGANYIARGEFERLYLKK